jgi:LPXTG-site transpeptidase (sortase) family protein
VSAQVIPIAADGGVLTPPSNPRTVGWWSPGAQPGARIGSAVLTAHTVHTGGGAFDDLDKLRPGALVTVITSTGRITYVVTSMTNYPRQSFAKHATELFDQTINGRLVLVTCEDWNGQIYLSNIVVIAELSGRDAAARTLKRIFFNSPSTTVARVPAHHRGRRRCCCTTAPLQTDHPPPS